jgi:signal transduction histidine kinase
VLKLRGDDPDFASRQREIIERNARHLSRLVDGLLEVSRINEGKIELRKEQVALRGLIQQAATSVQHSLQARRHELRVSVPPEEIYLEADPVRIVQILVNLLNNAVKYTDEGGQIELLAAVEGREVVMRVRDNGRGIDPELLPRVFDLFVQGECTLARSDGGLGLGLSVTRTLA